MVDRHAYGWRALREEREPKSLRLHLRLVRGPRRVRASALGATAPRPGFTHTRTVQRGPARQDRESMKTPMRQLLLGPVLLATTAAGLRTGRRGFCSGAIALCSAPISARAANKLPDPKALVAQLDAATPKEERNVAGEDGLCRKEDLASAPPSRTRSP